jgi:hypothetical protein
MKSQVKVVTRSRIHSSCRAWRQCALSGPRIAAPNFNCPPSSSSRMDVRADRCVLAAEKRCQSERCSGSEPSRIVFTHLWSRTTLVMRRRWAVRYPSRTARRASFTSVLSTLPACTVTGAWSTASAINRLTRAGGRELRRTGGGVGGGAVTGEGRGRGVGVGGSVHPANLLVVLGGVSADRRRGCPARRGVLNSICVGARGESGNIRFCCGGVSSTLCCLPPSPTLCCCGVSPTLCCCGVSRTLCCSGASCTLCAGVCAGGCVGMRIGEWSGASAGTPTM